jgi:hypothetical protein
VLELVAAGAALLGIAFLVNAFFFVRRDRRLRLVSISVIGVVMEHVQHDTFEGPVFHPVVKFTTDRGVVVRFEDGEGRKPPRDTVGQSVRVLYKPMDPHVARIDRGTSWGTLVTFVAAALLAWVVAAGMIWFGYHPLK